MTSINDSNSQSTHIPLEICHLIYSFVEEEQTIGQSTLVRRLWKNAENFQTLREEALVRYKDKPYLKAGYTTELTTALRKAGFPIWDLPELDVQTLTNPLRPVDMVNKFGSEMASQSFYIPIHLPYTVMKIKNDKTSRIGFVFQIRLRSIASIKKHLLANISQNTPSASSVIVFSAIQLKKNTKDLVCHESQASVSSAKTYHDTVYSQAMRNDEPIKTPGFPSEDFFYDLLAGKDPIFMLAYPNLSLAACVKKHMQEKGIELPSIES